MTIRAIGASYLALAGALAIAVQLLGDSAPGYWVLFALVAPGLLVGLHQQALRSRVTLRMKVPRSRITFSVSDLFAIDAHKVVSVNEFFDGELGDRIAKNSVHGQAIARLFNGDGPKFMRLVDASLAARGLSGEPVAGERARFPIGTTAVIECPPHKLFLTALCHTNVTTHKASATLADLWTTLDQLWRSVRENCNGELVALPLIGSGQGQVPMSCRSLIDVVILSFLSASQEREVTKELAIVLTQDVYAELDLRTFSVT